MRLLSPMAMLAILLIAAPAVAGGEPDWFTRVKEQGLKKASEVEVARHGKGILGDSLHVGECYYNLGRWEEGAAVFRRLLRSPDRNYAAAAMARLGEGLFHLGKKDEAKATFTRCLGEHPEAWLDGSIPELCRAWLEKLAGRLTSPEKKKEQAEAGELEKARREIQDLAKGLKALKKLIRELSEED